MYKVKAQGEAEQPRKRIRGKQPATEENEKHEVSRQEEDDKLPEWMTALKEKIKATHTALEAER